MNTAARHYRRWSPEDTARLVRLWTSSASLPEIAFALGRTEATVYWYAWHRGLPRGCPQGYESVTTAAKRTGFEVATLVHLLHRWGVRTTPWRGKPGAAARRHYHFVDSFDVDRAVEKWAESEIVTVAARRHGLCGETLKQWLIAAGHRPPARKKTWRLASSLIDGMVAERRALLSVRAHAARVGLCPITLARRLRKAGVLGEKRPGVMVVLPAQVVDAAIGRAA